MLLCEPVYWSLMRGPQSQLFPCEGRGQACVYAAVLTHTPVAAGMDSPVCVCVCECVCVCVCLSFSND
jgi:hypothetical protein